MDESEADWLKPIFLFVEHLQDSHNIVRLAHWGATLSLEQSDYVKWLTESSLIPEDEKPTAQSIADIELRVRVAQKEKENDFPLLHGHTLMGIWGALEACVEDLCVAYMQAYPAVLDEPGLARVSVPFAEFRKLSEVEKLRYLVSEVQQRKKTGLRIGIKVFEDLLESLGLDGEVHPYIRETLYEAQQVRNALAHRGGVADQRLCEACPNLGLSAGDRIKISQEKLGKITNAMRGYIVTVMNRIFCLHGLKPQTSTPGIPSELAGKFDVHHPAPHRVGGKWKAGE
ncbi:hypothetical protein [Streptomyces sp. NBC_00564]|uniref:hypothetical protein n=1 Tax=Streptomyces sp. NBC_00564 TaxID=2903663 RepID=UPI00352F3FDE|nr:hypothetical protein OG256_31150 [Streptomyces sp. NBC_00564]